MAAQPVTQMKTMKRTAQAQLWAVVKAAEAGGGDLLIGQKVKRLRVMQQITQEELAGRTDLSKGFISQLENDQTSPSIATLAQILDVLGVSLADFFVEAPAEQVVFGKDARVDSSESHDGVRFELLVSKAYQRTLDPALVTLEPGARTATDKMHEGEEYGFVMSGEVVLVLDGREHRVRKGESFSFLPSGPHYVANKSGHTATVLWVTSPPTH